MGEMTYEKAGVSIKREEFAIKSISNLLRKTFEFRKGRLGESLGDIGSFSNLMDMGNFALAMAMDGVGSKVLVAQELERYDTIGIDLVAMNVNDVICCGAEPIAMMDYLAMKKINPEVIKEIAHGIYEGAKKANIAVIGGETATLPEIITGKGENGFDLAATVIGVVDKDRIITGRNLKNGDVVLGVRSSGIHSNGLTLARKVLPKSLWVELLRPTRIYVKEVLELIKRFEIHGMANITGGGFRNLLRVGDFGFILDGMPEPPTVFKSIQKNGSVSDREMYQTFNMGIGFCLITSPEEGNRIISEYGRKYQIENIGKVVEKKEVRIFRKDGEIVLS